MAHPSPEETEQVFFLLKWWRELTLGLIGFLSTVALIKKGRNMDVVPVYLTDKTIHEMFENHRDNVERDMELCKLKLQLQMRKEFFSAMQKNNDDLLDRIKEMLEAHRG